MVIFGTNRESFDFNSVDVVNGCCRYCCTSSTSPCNVSASNVNKKIHLKIKKSNKTFLKTRLLKMFTIKKFPSNVKSS